MDQGSEYRQKLIAEYKEMVLPLLKYLAWFEQNAGNGVCSTYSGEEMSDTTLPFPVYNGTVMSFVKEAAKSPLMYKNYQYVYTRNAIRNHDDERRVIKRADLKDWDVLRAILSRYVLGGRVKGVLWDEGVKEQIFYLVLDQMKMIIEYWDKPLDL